MQAQCNKSAHNPSWETNPDNTFCHIYPVFCIYVKIYFYKNLKQEEIYPLYDLL